MQYHFSGYFRTGAPSIRGLIDSERPASATRRAPARDGRRTLVPIGGGKDSLVSVEMLKRVQEPLTAVWVGDSALIAACGDGAMVSSSRRYW